MKLEPSAHKDTFPRDNLPPFDQWPEIDLQATPEIAAYPKRMNVAVELLDKNIPAHGDRPVLWYGDGNWTYKDLQNKVNQIAHVLVEDFGIVSGNRVLIRGFNHPMFVACWFAIMKVGAVCVATMPLYRNRELTYMADFAKIGFAFCDKRLSEEMELTSEKSAGLKTICYYLAEGPDSLEARMASKPTTFDAVVTAADDVCLIAFTSGTTGPAKGCMHFHRDIMAINDTFARYVLKPTKDDIFTGSPPIAFTFGLGGLAVFPLRFGAAAALRGADVLPGLTEEPPLPHPASPSTLRASCMLADATKRWRSVHSMMASVSGSSLPVRANAPPGAKRSGKLRFRSAPCLGAKEGVGWGVGEGAGLCLRPLASARTCSPGCGAQSRRGSSPARSRGAWRRRCAAHAARRGSWRIATRRARGPGRGPWARRRAPPPRT